MLTSRAEFDLGWVDGEGGVLGRDQERGERGDDDEGTHPEQLFVVFVELATVNTVADGSGKCAE
jgi:hypothetical protein